MNRNTDMNVNSAELAGIVKDILPPAALSGIGHSGTAEIVDGCLGKGGVLCGGNEKGLQRS